MITGMIATSEFRVGTAGEDNIEDNAEGELIVNMTVGSKSATRNRVLHFLSVEHSLTFVSRLCNDGHTVS